MSACSQNSILSRVLNPYPYIHLICYAIVDDLCRAIVSITACYLSIWTDFVARLAGDEFVILVRGDNSRDLVKGVAERISARLNESTILQGVKSAITASIGIASYPEDGRNVEEMLRHADRAMYHAKHRGRNQYRFYSDILENTANLDA